MEERGTFRSGPTRAEMLRIMKEIDNIKKQSQINSQDLQKTHQGQERKKKQTELILGAKVHNVELGEDFGKKRMPYVRNTEPHFEEEFLSKPIPQKKPEPGTVPSYNPLDKSVAAPVLGKTKKLPYSKEKTVTVDEMKKPHVQTVGVLPVRNTGDVPVLNVMMQGKPALSKYDAEIKAIEEANVQKTTTPVSTRPVSAELPTGEAVPDAGQQFRAEDLPLKPKSPLQKPAILGATGTIAPVPFQERAKPIPKPRVENAPDLTPRKKPRVKRSHDKTNLSIPKSAKSSKSFKSDKSSRHHISGGVSKVSMHSSLHRGATSEDESVYSSDDNSSVGSGQGNLSRHTGTTRTSHKSRITSADSSTSQKSSSELLQEAQDIASIDSIPLHRRRRNQSKSTRSHGSLTTTIITDREDDVPKERSVDDIISSLKAQREQGSMKSEADIKIQEIMKRVMSRTAEVLGSSDDGVIEDKKHGIPEEAEEETKEGLDSTIPEVTVEEGSTEGDKAVLDEDTDKKEDQGALAVSGDHPGDRPPEDQAEMDVGDAQEAEISLKPSVKFMDSEDVVETFETEVDLEKAWQELIAPLDVTYSDVVNVTGEKKEIQERGIFDKSARGNTPPRTIIGSSVSFLSVWAPQELRERETLAEPGTDKDNLRESIHHFCSLPSDLTVPKGLQELSRSHHTPSKYHITQDLVLQLQNSRPSTPSNTPSLEERQKLMSAAARRILRDADATEAADNQESNSLEAWEKRAVQLFDEEALTIIGQAAPIRQDISRLYWTPAPPKMNLEPSFIRNTLFPTFQGVGLSQDIERLTSVGTTEGEEGDMDVMSTWDEADIENRNFTERILGRKHSSCEDLTQLGRVKYAQKMKGKPTPFAKSAPADLTSGGDEAPQDGRPLPQGAGGVMVDVPLAGRLVPGAKPGRTSSAAGSGRQSAQSRSDSVLLMNLVSSFSQLRRTNSAPELEGDDYPLIVPSDFQSCMEDVRKQKQYLAELRQTREAEEDRELPEVDSNRDMPDATATRAEVKSATPDQQVQHKDEGPTLAQQAREAGLKYVLYPQKKKKKRKKPLDPKRLKQIEDFLKEEPRQIHKCESLPKINMPVDPEVKVSKRVRRRRRKSLPIDLDFEEFLRSKYVRKAINVREWVRDLWDEWFDELFPPSEVASVVDSVSGGPSVTTAASPSKFKQGSVTTTAMSVLLEDLNMVAETEEENHLMEELYDEALYMTDLIEKAKEPSPFDLTRRGIIYRKLGKLNQSWDDLNRAIGIEPLLLDAYWHRHLLFLLKEKPTKALEDLNTILKINKDHVGAYRSRAEIFSDMGDLTMAIMNFSQTLKLDPNDHEAFYKRAELYEQRGEMLLALEDYKEATRLMPNMSQAIMKRGLYQFNTNKNWMAAIKDFTELLVQEPDNAVARTYRGRAHAKQGMYVEAVADLSAAVHLDPHNRVAFYHRGCLLRKSHPKQALQDLSVSILLDDSFENVMAYFHRGILYMDMGRHEDAIMDFDSVLRLDRTIAAAHVNLGLIYMTKLDNHHKAIQKFTNAIKVDPTYVRALVCRGEAHHKIHDLNNALKDFTRAIHLRPDQQHYYMLRGQILLEMKNLELASFCVQHAAELSHGLGSSATQQAAVQSFLHNYGKAIDVLSSTAKVQPTAPLYILLGKTQIKAKKYREAVESLEKALSFMKPWQERQSWPLEAAEVNYLIGMCHMEIPNVLKAYEAFNSAIKINPDYPEAYYQRGLTRTRLHQAKGILDFNRALALDPKLFQAYLSRAAYYGQRGRYSKGIYNCNEAIRLQPNSVRAYLYRGALKYYIKAHTLAIKDLCKAIELDTTCSLAYFNRAVCYHTVGDYQRAQRDYGIVLMLGDENSLKVLINRGLMYFAQKDYKNARDDFAQAVQVSPRDPKIRHTLGLCCHKLNRLEDAVAIYTSALEVNPFFIDAYLGRGNAYMDYGHEETTMMARRDYQRALFLKPECLVARVNLGYNMQISGHYKLAWNLFTACLELDPNYKPALEGRAIVSLQMSDPFAALLDMNTAIRLGATAELYVNRGVVNQFLQDHESAMVDYRAAIKKDQAYPLAYFNAANLYFSNRQFIQALEFYNKTLELNPSDESALLNRAITKVLMRDARSALEDFVAAIKLSPYSAHIYFNRGNLYTSLRRYQLAEKDYTQALKLQPDDPLVHKRRAEVRSKVGMREEAIQDYKRAIEIQSKKHLTT